MSAVRSVLTLRRELAQAERQLRARAEREAVRLAEAERRAWLEARDACHDFDRIRPLARRRVAAIRAGEPERFPGERRLAEMALREADDADVAYTVVSFAHRRDRLRFLRGGVERRAVLQEAIRRGGVHDERGHFMEILR